MGAKPPAEAIYFDSPAALRAWFEANHETADELWIGYYRKATGRPTVTWPETVDEALSFGWIDSVRYTVDEERFIQRLTPRRPRSNWSAVNIAKAKQLIADGRMQPAGLAAFEARADERSAIYSYEQRRNAELSSEDEARFRREPAAWDWFSAQAPSYRRTATHWVTSAKRPETRAKRLETLIADSAERRRVKPLTPPKSR
jgi:uncharacterized protein YdeI (YjbR/CyaY-like superfamily)